MPKFPTDLHQHFVSFSLDGDYMYDNPTLTCLAPELSMCHARFDCNCESWSTSGIDKARPWHLSYSDITNDQPVQHFGYFDPNFCNIKEWADNSDEIINGKVNIPLHGA